MDIIKVTFFCSCLVFLPACAPHPHREYHRIHVPTKIKTIYRTKVIKVPEHHHYFHTKEKIIQLPHDDHHAKYESEPLKLEEEISLTDSHNPFHKLDNDDFHGGALDAGKSYLAYNTDEHIISGSEKHHVYKKPARNKRRQRGSRHSS